MNTTDIHLKIVDSETTDSDTEANFSVLLLKSEHYKGILLEYCSLALQPSLNEVEQERMSEILALAIDDPVLSFWIEEGDHLVAHHLDLIDKAFIEDQQDRFRRSMGQGWIDSLWRDLQSSTKVLQAYLKREGLYSGSVDGVMGPLTQNALHQFKQRQPSKSAGFSFT